MACLAPNVFLAVGNPNLKVFEAPVLAEAAEAADAAAEEAELEAEEAAELSESPVDAEEEAAAPLAAELVDERPSLFKLEVLLTLVTPAALLAPLLT